MIAALREAIRAFAFRLAEWADEPIGWGLTTFYDRMRRLKGGR